MRRKKEFREKKREYGNVYEPKLYYLHLIEYSLLEFGDLLQKKFMKG